MDYLSVPEDEVDRLLLSLTPGPTWNGDTVARYYTLTEAERFLIAEGEREREALTSPAKPGPAWPRRAMSRGVQK